MYNLLRDMMNKGEKAEDKVKGMPLSTLEDMIEWIDSDEILLGHKEGETKLAARHTPWQLHEEQTAARYLKSAIEKERQGRDVKNDQPQRRDDGTMESCENRADH